MLRIVLGRDDIEVLDVKAQVRIPNLLDHDLVLDILAQDANGKKYDIEVQRSSAGASPQRAQYHLALIYASSLTKGCPLSEVIPPVTRHKRIYSRRFSYSLYQRRLSF